MANLTTPRNRRGVSTGSDLNHHEVLPSDLLNDDEQLREEMRRLTAANAELLSEMGAEPGTNASAGCELNQLRAEITELRACLEEMEQAWAERQKEYESLLEEKSEVIRGLHVKLQESQQQERPSATTAANPVDPAECADLSRLKEELEGQRRQVQEDEEALMEQMRAMELAMSRDRAELARQRSELQRVQAELHREAEQSSRDSGLRERLQSLQRRQNEPTAAKPARSPQPSPSQSTPIPCAPSKTGSGIFRRLFGGGNS